MCDVYLEYKTRFEHTKIYKYVLHNIYYHANSKISQIRVIFIHYSPPERLDRSKHPKKGWFIVYQRNSPKWAFNC